MTVIIGDFTCEECSKKASTVILFTETSIVCLQCLLDAAATLARIMKDPPPTTKTE